MRPNAELLALPHLNWRDIFEEKDAGLPADDREAIDAHFGHYVPPDMKTDLSTGKKELVPQKCVGCDEPLTGFLGLLTGRGGFEWGIAHGEGRCSNCGWPCTAHHFVRKKVGDQYEQVITLRNFILQYHPANVSVDAIRHRLTSREEADA